MIFRPKITNKDTNPNTITNINTEIKCQIYDFSFQNHKHKHKHKLTWLRIWDELSLEEKKKMENKVEWNQRWQGRNGAVLVLDYLWAYGHVSERAERWRGRGGCVRQWVKELRQLETGVRPRVAVRGSVVGPVVRLGVSEIVSWRNERRRCELKKRKAGVWVEC